MDEDTATRFVSSLVKSIQALCNGYIEFSTSIEVVGHIHLNIDRSMKLNYILTEEVSKSVSEGATLFASHSYHSKPPSSISSKTCNSKTNRRKSQHVPRVDDSESDPLRMTSLPRDASNIQSDGHSFSSSRLGEASECDDSQTDNFNPSKNSSPLLGIKPENPEPASAQTQNSLDRRRRNILSTNTTPPPAAKHSRTHSSDIVQNSDFNVIEIKEEPVDEPAVYFGDSSSHQSAGQDVQTPDFNNVVIESLDRVSQMEGTQLVAGGSILQVQPQQHQQPFPVMLHATNTAVPSVPLPTVPVPGPSTDSQATPSTSGERKTRRIRVKTSKAIMARTLSKTRASPKKRVTQSAGTSAKKSQEVAVDSSSPNDAANRERRRSLAARKLTRTFNYKSGYREYTEEDMNEAIELIHGGMPVIDAALKYGIPRATLFNRSRDGCKTHSGRCSEVFARTHGGTSSLKKRQKSHQYTKESVEKAIEAIHQGMPVIDASILYRIPRASLFIRSARGCPSHAGRCATVYSNGKLRRTKAPKHKYLTLHKQSTPDLDSEAPFGSAKETSVLNVTPVTAPCKTEPDVVCKTEPDDTENNDSAYSLQSKELEQHPQIVDPSGERKPLYKPLPVGSLVVKIERMSDSEN